MLITSLQRLELLAVFQDRFKYADANRRPCALSQLWLHRCRAVYEYVPLLGGTCVCPWAGWCLTGCCCTFLSPRGNRGVGGSLCGHQLPSTVGLCRAPDAPRQKAVGAGEDRERSVRFPAMLRSHRPVCACVTSGCSSRVRLKQSLLFKPKPNFKSLRNCLSDLLGGLHRILRC